MANRKYILVLSGGGAKGAFQVGALKYLFENGLYHGDEHILGNQIKFDYIAGISAGSLNAVMVAMEQFQALEKLWVNEIAGHPEKIWTSEFVDYNFKPKKGLFKKFLPKIGLLKGIGLFLSDNKKEKLGKEVINKILSIKSFASNEPLKNKLDTLVDVSKIQNTTLRVGYVSLNTGDYHSAKHIEFKDNNEEFKKAILGSSAMPVIWDPVQSVSINGQIEKHKNLVDGGIRNVSPLGDIIQDINADHEEDTEYFVIIINNHNGKLKPSNGKQLNFLDIAYRSLVDITLNEVFVNDIREFTRINNLVHQVEEAKRQRQIPDSFEFVNSSDRRPYRKFYYKIIQPEQFIGTTLDFSKEQINFRIKHGYEVAKKNLSLTPINDQLILNSGNIWGIANLVSENSNYWDV